MARSEARLQFGMWRAGLDGLGPHAKLVYCVLLTEPTVNFCGVGAIRVGRWAKDSSLTVEETEKALRELADSAHIVLDDDTDEVFVRTLIRNDGVASQPYVLKGALKEATRVASAAIRRVLAAELRKLPPRQADGVSKTGKPVVYPDPHATAAEIDPPAPPTPPTPPKKGPETLFDENPFETLSGDSVTKGSETLRGSGGGSGGGNSSRVATQVEDKDGSSLTRTDDTDPPIDPPAETTNKVAQALARRHREQQPLSSFVAVMKICKRALEAGYDRDAIEAALDRLVEANRSVTFDSIRIELDGPAVRSTSQPAYVGWQNLKQADLKPTGTDGPPLRAITGGDPS
jgi:hypothetical protein